MRRPEEFLGRALKVAAARGALSLELRAAMSLARLDQSRGERIEAARLLGEVLERFCEGFGTADLRAAEALLLQLASGTDEPR